VVFTHWIQDAHQSHRALARSVEIATRPFRTRKHTVLFETPSSTDQGFFTSFSPNLHVRLSDADLSRKMQAMAVYADQYAPGRMPLDLQNHARYRGSQIGECAAEAFFVARSFF
jgi:LmbE family N-acetylglucosaminyl deacetylase